MRRKTFDLDGSYRQAMRHLTARLGISRAVTLLGSYVTDVPLTVGWLRPVILLPASTLTALTPGEIEMILAHELAHIRRHDYVVNLLQAAVESLLFYHPAVWWVSGRIRVEREHRCDDLAVEACGNAVGYVRALAALDAIVSVRPRAALAATGAPLLARIERLLDRGKTPASAAPAWLGTLAAVAIALAAICAARPQNVHAEERAAPAPPPDGFLGGLAAAGYTDISVDEIIDWLADSLYAVDPVTGASVHGFALPAGTCVRCSGAAYDAAIDAIYYNERIQDARCYYVSAQDGAMIGSFAIPYTGLSSWQDNAFAPDGNLWAHNGDNERVYCIERSTTPTRASTWGALKLRYR